MRLDAVSAFANRGRAVAHVRGSYVPLRGIMHCFDAFTCRWRNCPRHQLWL